MFNRRRLGGAALAAGALAWWPALLASTLAGATVALAAAAAPGVAAAAPAAPATSAAPATAAAPAAPATPGAPVARGGTLVFGVYPEPTVLTNAITPAGPTQLISGKIFDGLLTYDGNMTPLPQLATAWDVAKDGLSIRFTLRPGVSWHDGAPFTSADVAFSLLDIWKKYHSRGRAIFANVVKVDTPDPLTVVLRLAKPAPYLLSALASTESQIVPKHLYRDGAVLTNPRNSAPIGTGPFRFVKWVRGSHIELERNPAYWDKGKPYLDKLLVRFLPDAAATATALETGAIQLANTAPLADLARLQKNPNITIDTRSTAFSSVVTALEFNLDRPLLRDARVRQAFAHALDRNFLVKNIWHGYGVAAQSPVPETLPRFYGGPGTPYGFDLKRAEALLEEAGLKRDAQGIRLTLQCDPYPSGPLMQTAQYLRSNLAKIGVRLNVRSQDTGEFINRIYTRRDFDISIYGASSGPDPAVGIQRFYWSKTFEAGIAFSNGAHYNNAQVDALLEAAQVELEPERRRQLYLSFQQIVQKDAVTLPLIVASLPTLSLRTVKNVTAAADGVLGNFAAVYLQGK